MRTIKIIPNRCQFWLCWTLAIILTVTACQKSPIRPDGKPIQEESHNASTGFKKTYETREIYSKALDTVANDKDFPFDDMEKFYEEVSQEIDEQRDGENQYAFLDAEDQYDALIGDQFSSKASLAASNPDYFFDKLTDSIGLSNQGEYYLQEIEEAVTNYPSKAYLIDTLAFYQDELAADSLPDLEEILLERMMAIGREAGKYWENARQSNDHLLHDQFHEGLSGNQKSFARNLISAGLTAYGEVFHELRESNYSLEDASKTGIIQAAFIPGGPIIVDTEAL